MTEGRSSIDAALMGMLLAVLLLVGTAPVGEFVRSQVIGGAPSLLVTMQVQLHQPPARDAAWPQGDDACGRRSATASR